MWPRRFLSLEEEMRQDRQDAKIAEANGNRNLLLGDPGVLAILALVFVSTHINNTPG
jgi:hypothetical protein